MLCILHRNNLLIFISLFYFVIFKFNKKIALCCDNKEEESICSKIFSLLKFKINILEKTKSGIAEYNSGDKKTLRKIILKNTEFLNKNKIKKIICDSANYYMFKNIYQNFTKNFNFEIIHFTDIILNNIKKIQNDKKDLISFCDSRLMGNYCKIYNQPREILRKLNCKIIEIQCNKKDASVICNISFAKNFPKIFEEIIKNKIKEFPKNINKIIIGDFEEAKSFEQFSEKTESLSEFILKKIKGKNEI